MNEIIKRNTIEAIVESYVSALAETKAGIESINKARERMNVVLSISDFSVAPISRHGVYLEIPTYETCKTQMKRQVWKVLVNMSGVYKLCSIKQRKEIDKLLYEESEKLPEITTEGVFSWVQNFLESASTLYEDSVKEIFDWLRPRDYYGDAYKTNEKYSKYVIGRKVILNCMFDGYMGYPSLRYDSQKWLIALENVFMLSDAKGTVKDDNLIGKIQAVQREKSELETEYFKLKWFKKGTLHVEFKRLDLVEKINAISGGMNLKAA